MGFHFAIWLIVCGFIISAFYFLLSAFSKGGWASSKFQSHSKQVSCQSAKENLDSQNLMTKELPSPNEQ